MDVFDRLGNLLKSLLEEEEKPASTDPDFSAAWEELDSYMGGNSSPGGGFEQDAPGREPFGREWRSYGWGPGGGSGFGTSGFGTSGFGRSGFGAGRAGARSGAGPGGIPEELRQDYRNLEVEFGAPLEAVRKSYRSLMVIYHPDRYASNPKKLQIATEITKKLGESYRRIKSFYESKR